MPPRQRTLRRATVTSTERLSPQLIRLTLDSPDLIGVELPFTDHYVKLVFAPEGAPYSWPFDPEQGKAAHPEHPPVTRTYSVRSLDATTGELVIDFVVHGDEGLAGPWAANAAAGDEIGFFGPGGAWAPQPGFDHFILAGDEAAAPAICAALELIPDGARASAYLEIADPGATFPVPARENVEVFWVPRSGAAYGVELARAVRDLDVPEGRVGWFVHGVAGMIKELRRHLFVELGVPRADASISGYWRAGMNEDGWQSSKHDFVAEMDSSEVAAGAEPAPEKRPKRA